MQAINCTNINDKLSGYIDLELTQQEMQAISLHLDNCKNCQQQYDQLVALKQSLGEIKLPTIEEDEIMSLLKEPTSITLQTLGWITLGIGLLGLVIMHWITFWQDDSISTLMKIFLTLFEGGGLLLFAGVLRQRLISHKTDRYKDVQL